MNNPDSSIPVPGDDRFRHRTCQAAVTVLRPDGAPLANQELVLTQTGHKFLFGAAGFDIALVDDSLDPGKKALAEARADKFLGLFNSVTLPFYWGRFEPQRGQPATDRLLSAAGWFVERGLRVKGHPLCWHSVTADWLLDLTDAQILEAQLGRIQREVAGFRGLIDMWDVVNEAVIMPVFDKYDNGITRVCKALGRLKTLRLTFEAARAANPAATLLINDFDMSPAYDILIEGCLEAGLPIDVIGIQSHMHQGYWGVEKTMRVLEQFTRFGLPIHFTETNLVSGRLMPPEIVDLNDYQVEDWPTTAEGEARQARDALQHYTTLFAHPRVEAITWWDFSDGGWLRAPAGLLRRDASVKPAYEALHRLIKDDWWTKPVRLATDARGSLQFTGFQGEYELRLEGQSRSFILDGTGTVQRVVQF
jgi:GH35 family endo-1,4-beta-xylanase